MVQTEDERFRLTLSQGFLQFDAFAFPGKSIMLFADKRIGEEVVYDAGNAVYEVRMHEAHASSAVFRFVGVGGGRNGVRKT